MVSVICRRGLLVAPLLSLISASAHSQTLEANAASKIEAQSAMGSIDRLQLAESLWLYARENQSSSAYLVAASLYKSVGQLREGQGGDQTIDSVPDGFWTEAEAGVATDPWARSALDRIRQRQSKGPVPGPTSIALGAGKARSSVLKYRGGEPATVWARPIPGQQMRVTVFDQNGTVTCKTEWQASIAGSTCRWTPKWTGAFRVQVESSEGLSPMVILTN